MIKLLPFVVLAGLAAGVVGGVAWLTLRSRERLTRVRAW